MATTAYQYSITTPLHERQWLNTSLDFIEAVEYVGRVDEMREVKQRLLNKKNNITWSFNTKPQKLWLTMTGRGRKTLGV